MPDKAQLIIQQSEARRLYEEALREIELERTNFEAERERLKTSAKACQAKGKAKECRHYTLAERLLAKKAKEASEFGEALAD